MAHLKGGEILIDISYLPIQHSQEEHIVSLDLLHEKERKQIQSLIEVKDGSDVVAISKYKPIRMRILYGGYLTEFVLSILADDDSSIFGTFYYDSSSKNILCNLHSDSISFLIIE